MSNLSCLVRNGIGRMIIQKIEGKLSSIKTWSLILVGSESEIDQLLQTAPSLSIFFPSENRIVNNHLTAVEVMHHLQTRLRELNFQLSQDIKDCLVHAFEIAYNEGKLNQWNENKVIEFINEAIVKRYQERILRSSYSNNDDIKSLLTNLELSDIDLSYLNANDDSFTESMSDLNSMVVFKIIKRNMIDLFNQISFMKNRHELGFRNITNDSYHMIFTGNPGTGKTTVAKMIGRIFHSLGLLSKGDFIVTERIQLVGRYIGETENNMQ